MAYKNNNNNRRNNQGQAYDRKQVQSDILKAMQDFIAKSIENDKNYSETVTSLFPSLNALGENGALRFCGVKNNDSVSDDKVLENSLGTTPILFALTHRIDFGKMYGNGIETNPDDQSTWRYFFGDIYDEYELKQLIQDINSKTYKLYYNVDLPTTSREEYYKVVIQTIAQSLALYSLIVSAWSFQNMKESKYEILGQKGYVANLFSQMNWDQAGNTAINYPYTEISNQQAKYRVPFQMSYSNAEWLQKVISKLASVWLPESTAQFWREMFGGVFVLDQHESVDRGAIQLVKFIPQFTYNFDDFTADDNIYDQLFYTDTNKDDFEAVLENLSASIESNLSKYPWLESTLTALGCTFHGFKYYLDGSGNISTEKCDDFTRALTAKNVNLVFDSNGAIRNALMASSLINYKYIYAEEVSEDTLPYLYMPYEINSQNKYAPMMNLMFDSFVLTDIRTTMIANKTNFASLLKGNLMLPILHILVASLSSTTRDPSIAKQAVVRLLVTPGFRYFFNVQSGNSLASICTHYDIIQDSCSIPLTKVVIKGSQGTAPTSPLTQVSVWPVECLSMYDGYDPTGYSDIDRARAARRFLFMTKNEKADNTNKKNNKKQKNNKNNNNGAREDGAHEEGKPGTENSTSNSNNSSTGSQNGQA
jgi:hypothetical protein